MGHGGRGADHRPLIRSLPAAFRPVASRGGLFFAGWPPAVRSVSSGLSPDGQRFRGGYSGPLPAAMGFSAAGLPLVPNDGQYPLPYPAACLRGGLFCRLAAGRAQRFFGLLAGRAAVLGRLFRPAPCASGFFGAGLSLLPAGWTAGEMGCRIAHHLRGGLPIPPDFPNLSDFPVLSEIFPSFRPPPFSCTA